MINQLTNNYENFFPAPNQCYTNCVLALVTLSWANSQGDNDYTALENLFTEWQAFEQPPMLDGIPDYTAATFEKRHKELCGYKDRLEAFDIINEGNFYP